MKMNEAFSKLERVVLDRRAHPAEGSYTAYLFEQGIDKILKKVGEETAEVIIAAKNGEYAPLAEEICDLWYHLAVLMAERGVPLEQVEEILDRRSEKIGNLKTFHPSDHES